MGRSQSEGSARPTRAEVYEDLAEAALNKVAPPTDSDDEQKLLAYAQAAAAVATAKYLRQLAGLVATTPMIH